MQSEREILVDLMANQSIRSGFGIEKTSEASALAEQKKSLGQRRAELGLYSPAMRRETQSRTQKWAAKAARSHGRRSANVEDPRSRYPQKTSRTAPKSRRLAPQIPTGLTQGFSLTLPVAEIVW